MTVDLTRKTFRLHRTSMFGSRNRMGFPMHLRKRIELWQNMPRHSRPHAQHAFTQLDDDHREFLITGMTPEEWDSSMGPDPEEGE